MNRKDVRHKQSISDQLHPLIYAAMTGLASWFALSAWAFAGIGYTDMLLAVVTGFIVIAVAIPFILWRVARKHQKPDERWSEGESLRDWSSHEFRTWQGQVKGASAAVEILLPIAAVAFGMTGFAIVLLLVAHHVV